MTLTNHWLKPLRAQSSLAQLVLLASLTVGIAGTAIGITGTIRKAPTAILMGYGLISPSLCCGLLANSASNELRKRLTVAMKDQAAIDQQIKTAWQQGHESGRTETLNEIEQGKPATKTYSPNLSKSSPAPIDRTSEIASLTTQLKTAKTQLATAQKSLTQAQNTNAEHLRKITKIEGELATASEQLQAVQDERYRLENWQRELEQNKESQYQRELHLARNESQAQLLQSQLSERDRRQDELERQIQQLNEEYSQALIDEGKEQYQAGVEFAAGQYALTIERQQATIEKLQARLDKLNANAAINKALPTFDAAIGGKSKKRKPAFLCGSQGSGKALHAAALCQSYASEKGGVIPFVLDISEGGEPDSSWARMGFPVTDDVSLFVSVLANVKSQIDNKTLMLRTQDGFNDVPAIVLIIDECLTAFNGLPSATVNMIVNALETIETQGDKRKVYSVLCGQDNQIQNTSVRPEKGSAIKLVNTGKLRNYLSIHLNDALLSRAGKDELQSNRALAEYVEMFGGSHFVAAVESVDGKGRHLKPFKHVSHHGHLLSESKPSHVPSVNIASPP